MNMPVDLLDLGVDKDICIIGKGKSVDTIDHELLKSCFVINVNDSFKIYEGHVAVIPERFYEAECLPSEIFVISDLRLDRPRSLFVERFHEDAVDNFQGSSLLDDELKMFDASFLLALNFAKKVIQCGSGENKIFMLGFDFEAKSGYSENTDLSKIDNDPVYADVMLHRHEKKFLETKALFHDQGLNIVHVGSKSYSLLNSSAFNAVYGFRAVSDGLKHSGVKLDRSDRVTSDAAGDESLSIVAEITTNHFGDTDRLLAMIHSAKNSGATHVKLQKRDVMSFYSPEKLAEPYDSPFGTTFKDYRLGLELSHHQFELVDNFCSRIGIKWFASVLDIASYEYLKQFNLERIKLPSTISEHKDLLTYVAEDFEGEVVISTGYTDQSYEDFIIRLFSKCKTLFLLQCTSSYPCALEDTHIGIVRHYNKLAVQHKFVKAGYSSHDIGSFASQLAIAAGAVMIEKHVKMGSVGWAHFDDVALDLSTDAFSDFVSQVKLADCAVRDEIKTVKATEHHKYWKN